MALLKLYGLAALARARSVSALAAASTVADAFARVGDWLRLGLRGRGGGARSGSELSHLCRDFVSNGLEGPRTDSNSIVLISGSAQ